MKKLTFMLIAALIAVTSWAQPTAVKSRQLLPEQFAVKTVTTLKQAPQMKKEMAPRQALKAKMQAPAKKANMKKAKAAPKKALDFTALLSGEPATLMVKSYVWTEENVGTEEEPDYQYVPANIARVTEDWTITLDLATMTASITGIYGGETAVTGTVDATSMAITIPYGQATGTSSYGTLGLASATGAESLVCTLTEDAIVFEDYWYIALIDGDYAGAPWSDVFESVAVQPNGTMAWVDSKSAEQNIAVDIDFDEDYFIATVWNFADEGVGIYVTLKPEGKFVIESQLIYEGGETYGDFYTYTTDGSSVDPLITGTGTENTLTFGSTWTCYAPSTGYWFGKNDAATITFDGTFVYPEIPDTPATPAAPTVTFFNFWNGESATVTLTVPCLDVDGNDIKGSLLTYQLFTMDDAGAPVALGEPIAYSNEENGTDDKKTVVLGEEAKNLTVIGAKSIYTAGGETHESEIAWFGIPQLVELPEGVEVKEYPVTADAYSGSWTTYTGTALVGVNGTDVYVQGILPHCPEGWAKGTLEEGVVTFPVQCVGTYNGSVYIYLAAYGDSPSPVTFTYNADEDIYTSEDYILANSYTDKFGFYYPYFDGMTIGTESIPELVELPEGAEVVEYPFVGTTYSSTGSAEFESKVNVAVVGDDVYVQGLNEYVPEVWVKGTKDAETGNIVFPTGQNLGVYETTSSSYQFFMVGYDGTDITDVVMTYNEEEDYYKLQNDLLVNGKKSALNYYKWYEAGSTIGIQITFAATFDFNAMDLPTSAGSGAAYVADGDITETTEFTSDDVTLAISPSSTSIPNRFWGTKDGPQLRVYSETLTFSVPAGKGITQIVFNHNGYWGGKSNGGNVTADYGEITNDASAKAATWTLAEGEAPASEVVFTIGANTQINSINVTYAVKQLPPLVETEVPDDLETSEWKIQATEIVYYEEEVDEETGEVISEEQYVPEEYTANAQVGFYTVEGVEGTEVYIQGLCPELPEAWVKGALAEDGTVTIPYSTFFGVYEYIDWDAWAYADDNLFLTAAVINEDNTATLTDVVFTYDAEAGTLTSNQTILVNADRREVNYYHWYEGMTITKIPEFATTPADPEITEIKSVNTSYPSISFDIPTVDVDGNELITSKLTYQLWVEKNGEATPLVLEADLYDNLDDDMSEIPYGYTDSWDIYETYSWDKIGIQSIYYGGGEVNKSNIAWVHNVVPVTVGEALYATYVAPADVDFTTVEGVEAFAATISPKKTYVQLTPVTTVPAGTAVVVKAEKAGTFAITKTEGAVLGAENDLVAAVDDVTADGTQYILAQKEEGVGFYKAVGTIAAGKGYLTVGGAGVKGFYGFDDDDATGIGNVEFAEENAPVYNVAGQRVSKMQKGVNIVNGKKILK